jgi:hypothetical protein
MAERNRLMPYRRAEDRAAAKRRYQASPKGKATAHRYYLARKLQQINTNPAPLAQAMKAWRTQ